MRVSVNTIVKTMLRAAREQAARQWPAARELASEEVRKLASTLAYVKSLLDAGTINAVRARALVRMQENAARSVLRTIEGIGVLTARRTIDAAMRAAATLIDLKDPRNKSSDPAATFKAGKDL
ncbi:MAG: hypothetical protein ACXW5U_08035 [Thermoanaerobaculia bacterium]